MVGIIGAIIHVVHVLRCKDVCCVIIHMYVINADKDTFWLRMIYVKVVLIDVVHAFGILIFQVLNVTFAMISMKLLLQDLTCVGSVVIMLLC